MKRVGSTSSALSVLTCHVTALSTFYALRFISSLVHTQKIKVLLRKFEYITESRDSCERNIKKIIGCQSISVFLLFLFIYNNFNQYYPKIELWYNYAHKPHNFSQYLF